MPRSDPPFIGQPPLRRASGAGSGDLLQGRCLSAVAWAGGPVARRIRQVQVIHDGRHRRPLIPALCGYRRNHAGPLLGATGPTISRGGTLLSEKKMVATPSPNTVARAQTPT